MTSAAALWGEWPRPLRSTLRGQVRRRLLDVSQRDTARRLNEVTGPAASVGAWDHRQDLARRLYTTARLETWLQILWDARTGALPSSWRVEVAFVAEDPDEEMTLSLDAAFLDAERLAAQSVLDDLAADLQPWEPAANVGWRAALDGWFAAITQFDTQALKTVLDEQLKWAVEESGPTREQARFYAEAVEQYRRMHDHHSAAYYAGLACGGLNVEWRQWYHRRIQSWLGELDDDTDERSFSRCTTTLAALRSGALDATYLMLPSYWP